MKIAKEPIELDLTPEKEGESFADILGIPESEIQEFAVTLKRITAEKSRRKVISEIFQLEQPFNHRLMLLTAYMITMCVEVLNNVEGEQQ